jgi:hypothetical protein
LFHELRIGAIVYDIATKDWDCQWTVDFFGVGILEATVENEIIAVDTKASNNFSTEEDKGEDVTVLEEELAGETKEYVLLFTFSRHFSKKPQGSRP